MMQQYLSNDTNINNVKVTKLKSSGVYSSFKIELPSDLLNTCLDPSSWPKGALIKEFEFARIKRRSKTFDQ
jgi:hypothetical protein